MGAKLFKLFKRNRETERQTATETETQTDRQRDGATLGRVGTTSFSGNHPTL